jgi:hypothetical protein
MADYSETVWVSGRIRWNQDGFWEIEVMGGTSFPRGEVVPIENCWTGHDGDRVIIKAEFAGDEAVEKRDG